MWHNYFRQIVRIIISHIIPTRIIFVIIAAPMVLMSSHSSASLLSATREPHDCYTASFAPEPDQFCNCRGLAGITSSSQGVELPAWRGRCCNSEAMCTPQNFDGQESMLANTEEPPEQVFCPYLPILYVCVCSLSVTSPLSRVTFWRFRCGCAMFSAVCPHPYKKKVCKESHERERAITDAMRKKGSFGKD